MLDTEQENSGKQCTEGDYILEEHNVIVEQLKQDLQLCKSEQINIRSELENLRTENQQTEDLRETFKFIHSEECSNQESYKQELENLQERIILLNTEKNSVLQLWQISLNTISALEEELRELRANGKGTKFYQEQVTTIKESYSEAIKMLEEKLSSAKDNFVKHQTLYQTSKEKIEALTKEKFELLEKFRSLRKDAQEKDRNNQVTIETLKKDLAYAKAETNKVVQAKLELEKKLNEVRRYAENIAEKDRETKNKMAEAIELIESAVREKELVRHRETLVLEEKSRLEHRLTVIASEYDVKIQELNKKIKDEIDLNAQRYLTEIKELKVELREKAVLVDTLQKELKFTQEKLDNIRTESSTKILNYEQKTKELQSQVHDESITKTKYDSEIKQLTDKIIFLESKLDTSNEKVHKLEQHSMNIEDQRKKVDCENKDLIKQYLELENQLAKTVGDKENLVLQLKSLKQEFDYEIEKRNNERRSFEDKIMDLKVNQKENFARESKSQGVFTDGMNDCDTKSKRIVDITVENKCHCCQSVLSDHMNKLQDRFDRRQRELINHVQVHQKLSKKWRDEVESLTTKFQRKTKELRGKITVLQKENNELNTELLTCKQQLAQCTLQDIQRLNEVNEIR